MTTEPLPDRLLRLPEVLHTVGLSKSAVYPRIKQGTFPKAVSLGGTSVAWIESEVRDWVRDRVAASRADR